MKKTLTLALSLVSISAFANFNEVECTGKNSDKNIVVEIEQPFPNDSYFRDVLLKVESENTADEFSYSVTARRNSGFSHIVYQGGSFFLDLDLWPDNQPRWGRSYRAQLRTQDLGNGSMTTLDCQFPFAN